MSTTPSKQFLNGYADWVVSAWSGTPRGLELRDHAIMGMGLSGECGEVIEAVQPCLRSLPVDLNLLKKEMGDLIYYWVRICMSQGFDVPQLWEAASRAKAPWSVEWTLLELARHCGRATDTLKKQVRDGKHPQDELASALEGAAAAWQGLCDAFELDAALVMEGNREKVNDRRKRGVLRGSGNDR